jgi:hypothetical protein
LTLLVEFFRTLFRRVGGCGEVLAEDMPGSAMVTAPNLTLGLAWLLPLPY